MRNLTILEVSLCVYCVTLVDFNTLREASVYNMYHYRLLPAIDDICSPSEVPNNKAYRLQARDIGTQQVL